ncbi:hypothetical protein [Deinococcus sp.]|uniref:hypothetical protein n=1 Tax=Deinococcus sp. TaxID=47478 RepID=UPI003CC64A07
MKGAKLAWTRLTGIAELHDVTRHAEIEALVKLLSDEPWLAPDLLHPRPWLRGLGSMSAEELLLNIFEQEWSGFVTHLGAGGPWVYAADVASVQALAHAYAEVVRLASRPPETNSLAAALRQEYEEAAPSLLARLGPVLLTPVVGSLPGHSRSGADVPHLLAAERAFWTAAEAQAWARRESWAAQRAGH